MSRSNGFVMRPLFWTGLLAASFTAQALAQESTGLGQTYPTNARNVSLNPAWRVYTFVRDGVKYVQANDPAGQVRMAVATSNGQVLILPMGSDAEKISLLTKSSSASPKVKVYDDGQIQIAAAVDGDGSTSWTVSALDQKTATCSTPEQCGSPSPQ